MPESPASDTPNLEMELRTRIRENYTTEKATQLIDLFFGSGVPQNKHDQSTLIDALSTSYNTLELANVEFTFLNRKLGEKRNQHPDDKLFLNYALKVLNTPTINSVIGQIRLRNPNGVDTSQTDIDDAVDTLIENWKPGGGRNLGSYLNEYLPKHIAAILKGKARRTMQSLDSSGNDEDDRTSWANQIRDPNAPDAAQKAEGLDYIRNLQNRLSAEFPDDKLMHLILQSILDGRINIPDADQAQDSTALAASIMEYCGYEGRTKNALAPQVVGKVKEIRELLARTDGSFEFRVGKFIDAMFAKGVTSADRIDAVKAINVALGVKEDDTAITQYADNKDEITEKLSACMNKHQQYKPDKLEDLLKHAKEQAPTLPDNNPLKTYNRLQGTRDPFYKYFMEAIKNTCGNNRHSRTSSTDSIFHLS